MTATSRIHASRAPQNTPAWIDARRDVVGSSDLPVLTGNTPYATSIFSLWAIKTRAAEPEPIDPATQEMYDLGHALEDDIAERYTIKTERPVRQAKLMRVRKDLPWAAASLDRVSAVKGERRIIEVKWVPHRSWFSEPERVPAAVQDQVQWQLFVTGWDVADVAVLEGSRVTVHEIGPNERYQADLLYIARWFRDLVERQAPPPIDGSEATKQTLVRLHRAPAIALIDPTPEIDALAAEWRDARALAKSTDEEAKRLANLVRFWLQGVGAEGVENEDAGYRISWTKNADSELTDWALVAQAQRKLLELIGRSVADGQLTAGGESVGLEPRGMTLEELINGIEGLYTRTEEGPRVLRPRFRNEETGKWT